MPVALGSPKIRHDIDVALHDQGDQCVVHDSVAHEVGEAVDAGIRQFDGIGVVEHVRGDAQSVAVAFVDRRTEKRRRHARGATTAIVDPDLDRIDPGCGKLAHRCRGSRLSLVTSYAILAYSGAPGPALAAPIPRPAILMPCAADPPRLLIGTHAIA